GVLDAESDREAVLASFVTGLDPADERLLRDLLSQARAADDD
ncbi:BlaI/MecI/CopY family transcriptional regulator, partial [Streptomyces sp. NPDC004783]